MAKVLWFSDAGCTTGFARATHSIGERLVEDYGHQVDVVATNYRGDPWSCERPDHDHVTPLRLWRPDLIAQGDIYGRSRTIELLGKVEPDVVVFLNDPQVILNTLLANTKDPDRILLQYRPILYYAPVDGVNLPTWWTTLLPQITKTVAMSDWGRTAYGVDDLVYHGIDHEVFWPIWEKPKVTSTGIVCTTKTDCKRAFGLDPQKFLVGRVDTNSGRKDYAATVKALWPLMKSFSDIEAWFHCEDEGPNVGIRFQQLFTREPGIDISRFHFPGLHTSFAGWPLQDLNVLFSAFDCFVSTSRGEGFGLTLAEAATCGIPIVAQNVSAIPEVVGPGGILVEPDRLFTAPSGEDNWLADIPAFTAAIERLYRSAGLRRDLGEAGAGHARSFSWDVAAQQFDEYITALASATPAVTSTDPSEAVAP